MDTPLEPWTCRRCGKTLAEIIDGEPHACMPPVRQVTDFGDRRVYVCECGFVQVWHRLIMQAGGEGK